MHTTSNRRRLAGVTAAAVTAALLLAGCSGGKLDVVQGTGGPVATDPAGAGAPAAPEPGAAAAQPLVAADMPGWGEAALPEWAGASIVQPCGTPTGVRDLQTDVRAAALTTPTGITVLNQVADYGTGDPVAAITDTISRALAECPAYSTETHNVVVQTLGVPEGTTMAGASIVATDPATGMRDVTVYWAALEGTSTVEVAVSAQLGAAGDPPMQEFATAVLDAARAKARQQSVPVVPAPALPAALSAEQEAAARAQMEADRAQTAQNGVDEATSGGPLTADEARALAEAQAVVANPDPAPFVEHGLPGAEAPPVIGGTYAEEEQTP